MKNKLHTTCHPELAEGSQKSTPDNEVKSQTVTEPVEVQQYI